MNYNNRIDITSLVLQIYNLILLMQDFNNKDLMDELRNQDEIYLKTIIKQQKEILDLLKKGSETNGRKNT